MSKAFRIGKSGELIYSTEYPDIKWTVPGLIPAGMTILGGRPKVGKSWLAMQIAQACGDHKEIVFGETASQGRVLYLALEDSERRLKQRMEKQNWSKKSRENIDYMTLDTFRDVIGYLHINHSAQKLYQIVEHGKYSFIVIDSFNIAFMGIKDIDNNTIVTDALKPLQSYSLDKNVSTLIIDHHNKQSNGHNGNSNPIDNILGSTAKSSITDTAIGTYKSGKGSARLMAIGRDIEELDIKMKMDEKLHWQFGGAGGATDKEQEIIDILMEVGQLGVTEMAKKLHVPKERVSERLSKLNQLGLVDRTRDGRNVSYEVKNGHKKKV